MKIAEYLNSFGYYVTLRGWLNHRWCVNKSSTLVPPCDQNAQLHYVGFQWVQFGSVAQSCPTLCDPRDGSWPGSPVPGILQARTLEWVAISFSNEWKWKVKVKSLSRVQLLATPWTAASQAPLSMGFSRQEYWSGVPFPSPLFSLIFAELPTWTLTCRKKDNNNKLSSNVKEKPILFGFHHS